MKKDQLKNALYKKKNCFGNFNVSLFWEEKLMVLLRALQLFGLLYVAFIEQWPTIDGEEGMLLFGSSYVYFLKNRYYDLITEKIPYLVNFAVWVGFAILVITVFMLIGLVTKCKKEFKYSKTLFKKWIFNILELLYFPILVNIIPYGACMMDTTKPLVLHKCMRKDDSYWWVFWLGQGVAGIGILVGLGYIVF